MKTFRVLLERKLIQHAEFDVKAADIELAATTALERVRTDTSVWVVMEEDNIGTPMVLDCEERDGS